MIENFLKDVIRKHSALLSRLYNCICCNKAIVNGSGNVIDRRSSFMNHCRILINGNNNRLILNDLRLMGGGIID